MNDPNGIDRYWSQPVERLISDLESAVDGLSTADAQRRLEKYGHNLLKARERATALGLFLNQFKSPIILILLFATGVSAVLQEWVDAVIVLLIVLGSAVLSFVQEYNAHNAAEKLRNRLTLQANVWRDGQPCSVPAEDVVPGDVILLSAGSLIPADGVLLEARDFYVSQAVLTGETFPVDKEVGPVAAGAVLTACLWAPTCAAAARAP
jgi:Mg2+-importing ATPase